MTKINDVITDEDKILYAETAIWCNENNAVMEEIEPENGKRRFQVKAIPEPTIEEKQNQIRSVRNQYLSDTDKFMIVDFPSSKEEKANYKSYRQYLRDYTEQESWWESNPKTFEEWKSEL